MKAKLVVPQGRERVGTIVARGDAEIGVQQFSELLPIDGIEILGQPSYVSGNCRPNGAVAWWPASSIVRFADEQYQLRQQVLYAEKLNQHSSAEGQHIKVRQLYIPGLYVKGRAEQIYQKAFQQPAEVTRL